MTEQPPRRQVVTGPRTTAVRRQRRPRLASLDEQDVVGELLVRSLVRAQWGLALRTALVLALTLGMLPVLFALVPRTRTVTVLDVPLPWLLLGALVYPSLVVAGWTYVRLAERNERDFVELVGEG